MFLLLCSPLLLLLLLLHMCEMKTAATKTTRTWSGELAHWALHYFCENLLNMPNTQRCMQSGQPARPTIRGSPKPRPSPATPTLSISPESSNRRQKPSQAEANQPWHCVRHAYSLAHSQLAARSSRLAAHICDINKLNPGSGSPSKTRDYWARVQPGLCAMAANMTRLHTKSTNANRVAPVAQW